MEQNEYDIKYIQRTRYYIDEIEKTFNSHAEFVLYARDLLGMSECDEEHGSYLIYDDDEIYATGGFIVVYDDDSAFFCELPDFAAEWLIDGLGLDPDRQWEIIWYIIDESEDGVKISASDLIDKFGKK